jgi:hypothetical protein
MRATMMMMMMRSANRRRKNLLNKSRKEKREAKVLKMLDPYLLFSVSELEWANSKSHQETKQRWDRWTLFISPSTHILSMYFSWRTSSTKSGLKVCIYIHHSFCMMSRSKVFIHTSILLTHNSWWGVVSLFWLNVRSQPTNPQKSMTL